MLVAYQLFGHSTKHSSITQHNNPADCGISNNLLVIFITSF